MTENSINLAVKIAAIEIKVSEYCEKNKQYPELKKRISAFQHILKEIQNLNKSGSFFQDSYTHIFYVLSDEINDAGYNVYRISWQHLHFFLSEFFDFDLSE